MVVIVAGCSGPIGSGTSDEPIGSGTVDQPVNPGSGDDTCSTCDELSIPSFTLTTGQPFEVILPVPDHLSHLDASAFLLWPEVPGLTFSHPHLRGTPTTVGTWDMSYSAQDGVSGSSLLATFPIMVTPSVARTTEIVDTYRGTGNEVFSLNPDAAPFADTPYTLLLGDANPEVFLIATNTSAKLSDNPPFIDRLDRQEAAATGRRVTRSTVADEQSLRDRHLAGIHKSYRDLPLPSIEAAARREQSRAELRRLVRVGDRHTFLVYPSDPGTDVADTIPATARAVTSDGTVTLVVWVADDFVDRPSVGRIANTFLRRGRGNDIYDWLTAIFGEPWGPHDIEGLIPAEAASRIHVLVTDRYFGGVYTSVNNYLATDDLVSNERLMFFFDDTNPLGWAHEFQHMISFYQTEVRSNFSTFEPGWLAEMSATAAEMLVYYNIWKRDTHLLGSYSNYNCHNHLSVTHWEDAEGFGVYRWYAIVTALGAYLLHNYGGAPLFGDIVRHHGWPGTHAVEAALRSQGYADSFADVLTNWAVATLLSDDPEAPHPYRYYTTSTTAAGGLTFRVSPVNLWWDPATDGFLCERSRGPFTFFISEFNEEGRQAPDSNRYVSLGRNTGTVRLRLSGDDGIRFTVVVKE